MEMLQTILTSNNAAMLTGMQTMSNINATAMQGQGTQVTSTKLTPGDMLCLQAAAGHADAQDLVLSEVFDMANGDEGKDGKHFFKALKKILATPKGVENLKIHLTANLGNDLRKLNLSHNGVLIPQAMDRGMTPFAVLVKEDRATQVLDLEEDIFGEATSHTVPEVREHRSRERLVLPQSYADMKKALTNYEYLLSKAIGGNCVHWNKVKKIKATWAKMEGVFGKVTTFHCVHLLWAIHDDAREFFQDCSTWGTGEVLPESKLLMTCMHLANQRIQPMLTCEYQEILNLHGSGITTPFPPTDLSNEIMISDSHYQQPLNPSNNKKPTINKDIPALCKPTVGRLRSKYPQVSFAALVASGAEGCSFVGLKVGGSGTCIDFALLGKCTTPNCGYKHIKVQPGAKRAAQLNTILEEGMKRLGGN